MLNTGALRLIVQSQRSFLHLLRHIAFHNIQNLSLTIVSDDRSSLTLTYHFIFLLTGFGSVPILSALTCITVNQFLFY